MVAKSHKMAAPNRVISKPVTKRTAGARMRRVSTSAVVAYQKWNDEFVRATVGERISMIRKGAEARMLAGGSEFFNIPAYHFQRIIGVSPATAGRKMGAESLLGPYASERLARVALIEAEAEDVFGSQNVAKDWLLTMNHALGDVPLELLDTEIGANEVKKVLSAIAYGGVI